MELLVISFIAGFLTILAPCTLTLLPIILGGSAGEKSKTKPLIVALSLGVSVIIFTIILKGTTLLFDIDQSVWKYISGVLITLFGLTMVFPQLWDKIAFKLKLYKSEGLLEIKKDGPVGAMILGASLGPVFSTCSPTFTVLVATILPQSFATGTANIVAFAAGLMIPMLLIGYGGQAAASKFRFASNPNGLFKKSLGVLLLLTGIFIFTGFDKVIEQKILETGYLGPIEIEQSLLEKVK